jgi:endonuclease-8
MPEGDTIWRTAIALRKALLHCDVTGFRSTLPRVAAEARRLRVVGSRVLAVEARGKHLLVRFGAAGARERAVLHTHMGMTGSWHLYRAGTPWRISEGAARAVIECGAVLAVCFSAPKVELLSPVAEIAHAGLAGLGPDVVAPAFDLDAALARLRTRAAVPIGVALLDQEALSGIGNIYKSETLFLCGADPFAPVQSFGGPALARIVRTARRLMVAAVEGGGGTGPRTASWVYRRSGRPCRRCGAIIARALQGEQRRSTYWCPRCQPPLTR